MESRLRCDGPEGVLLGGAAIDPATFPAQSDSRRQPQVSPMRPDAGEGQLLLSTSCERLSGLGAG
jgi:hypothetical protein